VALNGTKKEGKGRKKKAKGVWEKMSQDVPGRLGAEAAQNKKKRKRSEDAEDERREVREGGHKDPRQHKITNPKKALEEGGKQKSQIQTTRAYYEGPKFYTGAKGKERKSQTAKKKAEDPREKIKTRPTASENRKSRSKRSNSQSSRLREINSGRTPENNEVLSIRSQKNEGMGPSKCPIRE